MIVEAIKTEGQLPKLRITITANELTDLLRGKELSEAFEVDTEIFGWVDLAVAINLSLEG